MLRQYFNCNEILEIFLTSFYNILCYVGSESFEIMSHFTEKASYNKTPLLVIFRFISLVFYLSPNASSTCFFVLKSHNRYAEIADIDFLRKQFMHFFSDYLLLLLFPNFLYLLPSILSRLIVSAIYFSSTFSLIYIYT